MNANDLGQVLVAIMVVGAHLDAPLERLDGSYTGLERRTLPSTACMLFTFAALNDAGVLVGVALQLGLIEDGTLEPFGGSADNLTLAKADVSTLVEQARAAAAEIAADASLARLVVEPPTGNT